MGKHNIVGKEGEAFAREYLIAKGYKILNVNWCYNFKEIDIIAQYADRIIFVEVKTRSSLNFELPKKAVTIKKMKNLVYAADIYLNTNNIEKESQFDIISVLASNPPKILEHIEQAFSPNELI